MSHFKLNSLLIIAVIALAAISCKKKEEDNTTLLYLKGTLNFELPEFILPGETFKMTPSGLSHPDGEEIGYYWKVTPTMTKYDTTRFLNGLDKKGNPSDGSFTHKFSDTLQIYTVYCYAYSEEYTNSSASKVTMVVSPGPEGSVSNTGINPETDPYITVDEEHRFYYTTIGNLDWFRWNLGYTESGAPYVNSDAMDGVLGRYYSYDEAMTACPEGWRLPTDKEWLEMLQTVDSSLTGVEPFNTIPGVASKLMADVRFNGEKAWEYWPAVGEITNETKLSIIPAGYANLGSKDAQGKYSRAKFTGYTKYAAFWTADLASEEEGTAFYRYLYCDQPDLLIGKGDRKFFGASVRCVRPTSNQ